MSCPVSGRKAFSLIEILLTIVVTAIVGLSVYNGVVSSSESGVRSKDRAEALRLLQEAVETVRVNAVNTPAYFDRIGTIATDAWTPVTHAAYPDSFFQLKMTLIPSTSVDLKKLLLTVKWTDKNGAELTVFQNMDLSRPPQVLFGNITGRVSDSETGGPLPGATVKILQGGSPNFSVPTNESGRYTFVDADKHKQLPEGDSYRINVARKGYLPYTTPEADLIRVAQGIDTQVDVTLERNVLRATVSGEIRDANNSLVTADIIVSLSNDGGQILTQRNSNGKFLFTIIFPEGYDEERDGALRYTLATGDQSGEQSFPFYTTGGVWCGDLANEAWGKSLHYRGWSSARAMEPADPAAPWFGNEASDKIELKPDDVFVMNIRMVRVPRVDAVVTTREGNTPLPNATVSANYAIPSSRTTDGNGQAILSLPAMQALFPEGSEYTIDIYATRDTSTVDCCGNRVPSTASQSVNSGYLNGSVASKDYSIVFGNDEQEAAGPCGGVNGSVSNAFTGSALAGANVVVQSKSAVSGDNGAFVFHCDSCALSGGCPKPLVGGTYPYSISRTGYYTKTAWAKQYSNLNPQIFINTLDNAVNQINDALFPVRTGTLEVIAEGVDGNAVDVTFYPYDGGVSYKTIASNTNSVTFENIPETWPPAGIDLSAMGLSSQVWVHSVSGNAQGYTAPGVQASVTAGGTSTVTLQFTRNPPVIPPDGDGEPGL